MKTKKATSKTKKVMLTSLVALFAIAMVMATAAYFHSVSTTVVVTEARSSADLPVTINAYSGETTSRDITIKNDANVPLCSILSYTEDSNVDGVVYTSNLDGGLKVTTNAGETNTYTASFTADETTLPGTVEVTVNYEKVKC